MFSQGDEFTVVDPITVLPEVPIEEGYAYNQPSVTADVVKDDDEKIVKTEHVEPQKPSVAPAADVPRSDNKKQNKKKKKASSNELKKEVDMVRSFFLMK